MVTLGARDLDTLGGFYLRLGWSLAVDLDDFAAFQTAGAVLWEVAYLHAESPMAAAIRRATGAEERSA